MKSAAGSIKQQAAQMEIEHGIILAVAVAILVRAGAHKFLVWWIGAWLNSLQGRKP